MWSGEADRLSGCDFTFFKQVCKIDKSIVPATQSERGMGDTSFRVCGALPLGL